MLARKPGQLDLFICGTDGCILERWRGSFVPGAKVSVLSYTCGKDGHVYASHIYGVADRWMQIVSTIARTNNLDLFACGDDAYVV